MYNLSYFKENDRRVLLDFMHEHPFAFLIGVGKEGAVATQVPLLMSERTEGLFFRGHIMRNQDHHRALQQKADVLCVFSGPHSYVSARWYSNPQTGSTWNYMSVHARGAIRFLEEAALREILEQTTARFEKDENSPALFRHLPQSYVDALIPMIVGFEIEVRELENVFKRSQNRDEQSYENIIRELSAQGGDGLALAGEMRKRKNEVFSKSLSD